MEDKLSEASAEISLVIDSAHPHEKVPNLEMYIINISKMTSIEDDLNGRQPEGKTISMEDDLNQRRTQWKTNKVEAKLNGRRPGRKTSSMEDDLNEI